ncbi:PREDICTED: gamma-glutamyltranspeptidase 1-like [Ipomoea nil]|uniref:gamma-glutamyltranspeptidase 1-like n=1 Tax=Ipomoea nil TaxID=35883 RepID=UPI00090133FB|nr:PREDICTED: gamma-glutamyltranspeptidase 1-like [Ipomoea nil]
MSRNFAALFLWWILVVVGTWPQPLLSYAEETPPRREITRARHGVVATDDRRCSRIGRDVLVDGGHAVDAAVAAALCLGVVSPASSGIGGGAFMLLRSADGAEVKAFDMRETAPNRASQNMYAKNPDAKARGALSIATPGELAGLYEAWGKYGNLPWKRLVRPAERLARKGFAISKYLRMQMESTEALIMADSGLKRIFAPEGKLLQAGDICRNKKLAKTLRIISKLGVAAFYNGSIGARMIRDIQKAGGILTTDDLNHYRVKIRKPIVTDVMGLRLIGMPPPSSGAAAITLILNILSQYGFSPNISPALQIHREIEALKHAFALRMSLGDPDFVDLKNVLAHMLSPKFAAELKKTIFDNTTFNSSHYGGRWNQVQDHGTSHVSIVDSNRNAVSMTCTINAYFGSAYMSPSTGIVLNNEMDDFSVPGNDSTSRPPAPANFIRPLKRPLSSMSPTIVLNGEHLKAVVGASGGAMIIAGTTEVFLNHFAKGMDPLSSVMAPRYYHQLYPNVLQYENWTTVVGDHFELGADIRLALQNKGHVLSGLPGGTICQFIVQELEPPFSGLLVGVSDPRKGGFPSGY